MEAFGKPKRQLLIGSVQDARDSQILAKEQFVSALEKFKEVTNYSGGLLEDKTVLLLHAGQGNRLGETLRHGAFLEGGYVLPSSILDQADRVLIGV